MSSKQSGAQFSEDGIYRYALWRIWNEDRPLIMYIGLNPSRAGHLKNDPTIQSVMRIAGGNGYGGFYMMNLFGLISPYPTDLLKSTDPLGDNDVWLDKISLECETVCFAWGAFGASKRMTFIRDRAEKMKTRFPSAHCLGMTKSGHPSHPLFLPGKTKIIHFENNQP